MHKLAVHAFAAVLVTSACGPRVDDSIPEDWPLGDYSPMLEETLDPSHHHTTRIRLEAGGGGQVETISCRPTQSVPLTWELLTPERVRVEYGEQWEVQVYEIEAKRICAEQGVHAHVANYFPSPEQNPGIRDNVLLTRSVPCVATGSNGIPCDDAGGGECDLPQCQLVWCEGGEPEPC